MERKGKIVSGKKKPGAYNFMAESVPHTGWGTKLRKQALRNIFIPRQVAKFPQRRKTLKTKPLRHFGFFFAPFVWKTPRQRAQRR